MVTFSYSVGSYLFNFTTGQTSTSFLRHHHQLLRLMPMSAFPDKLVSRVTSLAVPCQVNFQQVAPTVEHTATRHAEKNRPLASDTDSVSPSPYLLL